MALCVDSAQNNILLCRATNQVNARGGHVWEEWPGSLAAASALWRERAPLLLDVESADERVDRSGARPTEARRLAQALEGALPGPG